MMKILSLHRILLLQLLLSLSQKYAASSVDSFWASTSRLGASLRRTMVERLPPLFKKSYTENFSPVDLIIDEEGIVTSIITDDPNQAFDVKSNDDERSFIAEQREESSSLNEIELKRHIPLWDLLTSAFRMSLDAKDDLFSNLEQTVRSSHSLLTSAGGASGSKWKSSTAAFIASKAASTLERVGKRIIDELSTEEPLEEEKTVVDHKDTPFQHISDLLTSKANNGSETHIQYLERELMSTSVEARVQEGGIEKEKEFIFQIKAENDTEIYNIKDDSTATVDRPRRGMRAFRKGAARITGFHGFFSGKRHPVILDMGSSEQELNEDDLSIIRRRIAAIQVAREKVADKVAIDEKRFEKKRKLIEPIPASIGSAAQQWRRNFFGTSRVQQSDSNSSLINALWASNNTVNENERADNLLLQRYTSNIVDNQQYLSESSEHLEQEKSLADIDRMIAEGQRRIQYLQCQKDLIQQHLNPLFNYTSPNIDTNFEENSNKTIEIPRMFNFPSPQLVHEYIHELIDTHRLSKMNHTHLWRYEADNDKDDDIGDDLLTPSADAQRLYDDWSEKENGIMPQQKNRDRRYTNGSPMGGGSWLLRQSLGKGGSIGEKIGETVETAAYKGVCSAVMSFLARLIAQLHGVNILMHSHIRLFMQNSPDLPPVSKKHMFDAENYAQETLRRVIRKSSKKRKMHHKNHRTFVDDQFIQRDAVVETLLSHCQISAPLLKLFPLAWQRAMLGNCVTLVLAIMSDFCDSVQFPILGHMLSLSLQPITEDDILRQIGTNKLFFNHRFAKPAEFEAAVRATATDISENLKFLDRWHERALGSDLLRAQLGNLIARIVLTLVDEILCGARIDLWTSQAGGPRLLLGLQYK